MMSDDQIVISPDTEQDSPEIEVYAPESEEESASERYVKQFKLTVLNRVYKELNV